MRRPAVPQTDQRLGRQTAKTTHTNENG